MTDDFERIAAEQGWSDSSRIAVLQGFISSGMDKALAAYAQDVARQENEDASDGTIKHFVDVGAARTLEIKITHEGVIFDLIDGDGDVYATEAATFEEITARMEVQPL